MQKSNRQRVVSSLDPEGKEGAWGNLGQRWARENLNADLTHRRSHSRQPRQARQSLCPASAQSHSSVQCGKEDATASEIV